MEKIAKCSAHPDDPEHTMFRAVVKVYAEWVVTRYGEYDHEKDFISCEDEPTPNDEWTCDKCGAHAIVIEE